VTDQNPLGLLPCPFCGTRDVELRQKPRPYVACNICGSRTGQGLQAEAASAWNARAHRPVEQEAVAWRWRFDPDGGPWSYGDGKPVGRWIAGDPVESEPLYAASPPSRALSPDERESVARLADDHRTRNLYREDDGFFRLKVREDDLRTLLNILQPEGEANG